MCFVVKCNIYCDSNIFLSFLLMRVYFDFYPYSLSQNQNVGNISTAIQLFRDNYQYFFKWKNIKMPFSAIVHIYVRKLVVDIDALNALRSMTQS